ncbi:hypothetical protein [Clostridium botulinum]|uniref:hypothetical protein n=1 Tax=Clostridium botulinum TaxID=1491 RepID=UPI001C9ADB8C|nr:hypothetical protein [Clostridium botulinum]MBY6838816.1 hypothetical protein [Clostridium botulinum]
MRKYIGKYKILCEWDRNNLEPIKDDTYIACYKNGQIYRVDNEILAYYRLNKGNSYQFSKKLIDLGVQSVNNCSSDGDILIYFNEENLNIVANEVNASTSSANRKPESIKNLRNMGWFKENKQMYIDKGLYSEKKRELTEEQKQELKDRMEQARKVRLG